MCLLRAEPMLGCFWREKQPSMGSALQRTMKKGGLSAALLSFYFFSMADSTTMSSTYACDGASAGGFFTS